MSMERPPLKRQLFKNRPAWAAAAGRPHRSAGSAASTATAAVSMSNATNAILDSGLNNTGADTDTVADAAKAVVDVVNSAVVGVARDKDMFSRSRDTLARIEEDRVRRREREARKRVRREEKRALESVGKAERRTGSGGDRGSESESENGEGAQGRADGNKTESEDGDEKPSRRVKFKSSPISLKRKSVMEEKVESETNDAAGESESSVAFAKKHTRTTPRRTRPPVYVQLLDDSDQESADSRPTDISLQNEPVSQPQNKDEEEQLDGSDEEYALMAREARARRARAAAIANNKPSTPPKVNSHKYDYDQHLHHHHTQSASPQRSLPPADPTLKLFIHSTLLHSTPLFVQRKLSQRLKEVREVWLSKQSPTFAQTLREGAGGKEEESDVFLTWRGKRIFDTSSCRSLGVGVDGNGDVFVRGQVQVPGEGSGQLVFEAVTQRVLDERGKRAGGVAQGQEKVENWSPQEREVQRPKVQGIKIVLKAKGFEDYKLIVKPTTKFEQITNVWRKQRVVEPEKTVFLVFDGDRLEPGDEVSSSEIADMDNVEVHVR